MTAGTGFSKINEFMVFVTRNIASSSKIESDDRLIAWGDEFRKGALKIVDYSKEE